MFMMSGRSVELELLASTLRRHERILRDYQVRMNEVLEEIEKRDMSAAEARELLGWLGQDIRNLGAKLKQGV